MIAPPWFHQLDEDPELVLLVASSSLVRVEPAHAAALSAGAADAIDELRPWAIGTRSATLAPPPAPRALALNVATSCNLGCGYCYADAGRFGGQARGGMTRETAFAAIDALLEANRGGRVTLGFIGGEPFANRALIHDAVAYAEGQRARHRVRIGYSVTTNGTLLRDDDVALLRRHAFTVTVSIDGGAALHDRLRPTAAGRGSFDTVIGRAAPLLEAPGGARVAARVTLTRLDLDVRRIVGDLRAAGFGEIGVAPLRSSPRPELALAGADDWTALLRGMREAASAEWERLVRGEAPGFTNFVVAMREIARGANRALPCGAADNYVSLSAEGTYYACHRTIDDERFRLGDLGSGLDDSARETFLGERHVDRQEPCRSCWARYLCGGGCHAEVIDHGRDGCDYIRGWLETCLSYYDRACDARPDLFADEG